MTALSEKQQDIMRNRFFAQHCIDHATEFCPRLVEDTRGRRSRVTWAELFRKRIGKTPQDYLTTSASSTSERVA